MPVPFTCPHSDKIRTLRKELKVTTGMVKQGLDEVSRKEGKNLDDCSRLEKGKINHNNKE